MPFRRADYRTILLLHRIFGNGGLGGASQYDDERGVHIYPGTGRNGRRVWNGNLRAADFPSTVAPERSSSPTRRAAPRSPDRL